MCGHIFINLNNSAKLCYSQQPFLLRNREGNSNKGQKCFKFLNQRKRTTSICG